MPAKQLSEEQLADAARLKAAFKTWQRDRKAKGLTWAQDDVAEEFFGFGQSALAQYLNGTIPLNPPALKKFSVALGIPPADISPGLVAQMRALAQDWINVEPPKEDDGDAFAPGSVRVPPKEPPRGGPGIRLNAAQKRRTSATKTKGRK